MKLQDQVCTLEQGKKLIELGVISYGLYVHVQNRVLPEDNNIKPKEQTGAWKAYGKVRDGGVINYYPAFTVAELGVMLPCESGIIGWEVHYNDHLGVWNCAIMDLVKWEGGGTIPPTAYESEEETMAQAMADTLIHCLENKLTTPEEVNNRLSN